MQSNPFFEEMVTNPECNFMSLEELLPQELQDAVAFLTRYEEVMTTVGNKR